MTTNRWIPLSMIYVVVLFFSVGVYSAVNRLVSSSIGSSLGPVSAQCGRAGRCAMADAFELGPRFLTQFLPEPSRRMIMILL